MYSYKYWRLRVLLFARRWIKPVRARAVGQLDKLGFIHFARWVFIDKLPTGTGEAKRLRPIYLYFESNFNGGFEEYIDAFSYVIPTTMKRIFGPTVGFPGPKPATRFKAFIRLRGYEAEHFYSAYPEATAGEIAAALRTVALLRPVLTDEHEDDHAFQRAWRRFLTKARL